MRDADVEWSCPFAIAPEQVSAKCDEERFAQAAGERPHIRWFLTIDEAEAWISETA